MLVLPRTSLRDVNEDCYGKTPRDYAHDFGLGGESAVVQALVAAGGIFGDDKAVWRRPVRPSRRR